MLPPRLAPAPSPGPSPFPYLAGSGFAARTTGDDLEWPFDDDPPPRGWPGPIRRPIGDDPADPNAIGLIPANRRTHGQQQRLMRDLTIAFMHKHQKLTIAVIAQIWQLDVSHVAKILAALKKQALEIPPSPDDTDA